MNSYSPYQVDIEELLLVKNNWDVFADKFIKLPIKVKDVMISAATTNYLEFLSKKLGLNQIQSSDLSRIIRDTLLADAFLGDFPALISSKLGVVRDTADQIARKIVSELFVPAIEDIKAMQKEKFSSRISQSQTNQTQTQPPRQNINPEQGNVINLRNQK